MEFEQESIRQKKIFSFDSHKLAEAKKSYFLFKQETIQKLSLDVEFKKRPVKRLSFE